MSFATPAATSSYFQRFANQGARVPHALLGATELTVSRFGFGTYRVHEFDPDHRHALEKALLGGINLIDTSANYTDGSSERLIGEVTSELFAQGKLKREEIVFVTKAGYLQGVNLKRAKELGGAKAYPDMVEYQSDCWHNISPEFLAEQITQSLARLKIETIDVLLLHNPEYFLKTSVNREQYYARIEKAFRHLETERERGRIRYYGVSSNTFPEPEAKTDFTSLSRLVEISRRISKTPRFAVIQLPFNLYEAGGALIKNNQGLSTFELAAREKIGVLTNRPFNSIEKGRLVRLTSFPSHDPVEIKGLLHTAIGRAVELERKAPEASKGGASLTWAQRLRDKMGEIDDLLMWKESLAVQIMPAIRASIARVPLSAESWRTEYSTALQEVLNLITQDLENHQSQKTQILIDQITQLGPELKSSRTLSRMMARLYLSFPQITTILAGLRTPAYVEDLLQSELPGNPAPLLSEAQAIDIVARSQRHRL
jgi:hypothetical protein